jgi:hypothetical protein
LINAFSVDEETFASLLPVLTDQQPEALAFISRRDAGFWFLVFLLFILITADGVQILLSWTILAFLIRVCDNIFCHIFISTGPADPLAMPLSHPPRRLAISYWRNSRLTCQSRMASRAA